MFCFPFIPHPRFRAAHPHHAYVLVCRGSITRDSQKHWGMLHRRWHVTRECNMAIRLEVRTEERKWVDSPEGFHSTDNENGDTLADFCDRHKIPYSRDFVSVWAMPADSSQVKQLGFGRTAMDLPQRRCLRQRDHRPGRARGGWPCVGCQRRFPEHDSGGSHRREKADEDVGGYLREMLFIFPQDMGRAERIVKLEEASTRARRSAKRGDAEARLLRPLANSDKKEQKQH